MSTQKGDEPILQGEQPASLQGNSPTLQRNDDPSLMRHPPTLRLAAIFFGTICLLWLTHVYGLFFFGTSAYFSFNDLATLSFKNIHILGAAVRLLLPVVVGFGLARLSNGLPLTEATVSAFLGALLLCWPTIYFPDLRSELVNEDLAGRPAKLLMIDGLCILSYSALGRLGAIGGLYYENLNAHASIQSFWKKVRPADLVWTLATGLLTNAIWELTTRNSK